MAYSPTSDHTFLLEFSNSELPVRVSSKSYFLARLHQRTLVKKKNTMQIIYILNVKQCSVTQNISLINLHVSSDRDHQELQPSKIVLYGVVVARGNGNQAIFLFVAMLV